MVKKALLSGLAVGALTFAAATTFAADNPLAPSYQNAQTKKYIMEFCNLDMNSDGIVSMEEFLNKGNPLQPGFDKNPKLTKKLEQWKAMAKDGDKVNMEAFVAFMDSNNPLSPSYKKK